MYGLDDFSGVENRPDIPQAGTEQFFEGNTSVLDPTTNVSDWWLNMIQDEISNVITGAGLTLNKNDNTQFINAIHSIVDSIILKDVSTPYITTYPSIAYWYQGGLRYASHPDSFFKIPPNYKGTAFDLYKPSNVNSNVKTSTRIISMGTIPTVPYNGMISSWYSKLFTIKIEARQTTQVELFTYAVDDYIFYTLDRTRVASSHLFHSSVPQKHIVTIPKGKHVFSIVTNNQGGKHPGDFFFYAIGDLLKNPYITFIGED